jgi:ketosteroid isomerase-like protein
MWSDDGAVTGSSTADRAATRGVRMTASGERTEHRRATRGYSPSAPTARLTVSVTAATASRPLDARGSSAVPSAATMTIERLRRFFEAWNAHDVESIASYFTPDGAYLASIGPDDEGTAFRGVDEIRRGVAAFLGTFGDVRYTDLHIGMDGDHGYASWTFHGTREGSPVTYRGVDLFTFEGDRIALKDAYRKERSRPIGG